MQKLRRFLLLNESWFMPGLVGLWTICIVGIFKNWWRAPANSFYMILATVLSLGLLRVWGRWQREKILREHPLPQFLKRKLRHEYPQFSSKDAELVERGLRQFFLACLRSKKKYVAMPSKAVDSMWHEFILSTKAYQEWCALGLGWFLHHTPAIAMGPQAANNDGLRRAWFWACKDETIKPGAPTRLPLLFALDAKLNVHNGFVYEPNCRDINKKSDANSGGGGGSYCGTDFSSDSYSGDSGGFGGADSSSSDSGSDDGGDGGGGDGGGDGGGGGCGGGD